MLNMFTCTFRELMDKCSTCIPAHSDGGWMNAQYVYLHNQRVGGRMLNMFTCTFREFVCECSIRIRHIKRFDG